MGNRNPGGNRFSRQSYNQSNQQNTSNNDGNYYENQSGPTRHPPPMPPPIDIGSNVRYNSDEQQFHNNRRGPHGEHGDEEGTNSQTVHQHSRTGIHGRGGSNISPGKSSGYSTSGSSPSGTTVGGVPSGSGVKPRG